jgi:hypothetical protein
MFWMVIHDNRRQGSPNKRGALPDGVAACQQEIWHSKLPAEIAMKTRIEFQKKREKKNVADGIHSQLSIRAPSPNPMYIWYLARSC